MVLEAWTGLGNSLGVLTCSGSTVDYSNLIDEKKQHLVFHLSFTKANINTNCTLQCSGNSFQLSVKGELEFIPDQKYNNETDRATNPDKSEDFDLTSIFGSSWFRGLIIGLLCFFLVIMLVSCSMKIMISHFKAKSN